MTKSQEPILFDQGSNNDDVASAALVCVSVESALLGYDVEIYNHVVGLLDLKYNCTISDCYKHPEYLLEVFEALPRNSRYRIMESIRKGLGEFSYIKPISKFLNAMNL